MKIIECVPNFSEGRNEELFNAIKDVISKTPDVKLLNLEPDADYNRVVVTLAGNENSIIEGAVNACKTAAEMIDMTRHKGEHPRLGAIDVVPFVPVANVTIEECVECAKKFGERVGKELGVPIYLYEEASTNPDRKMLRQIRSGEYEGIKDKIYKQKFNSISIVFGI